MALEELLSGAMHEYVTLSSSSYDPAALASKLTEKSGEGWEVVSIVPTGGDVTAFLRRATVASEPETEPGDEAALVPIETDATSDEEAAGTDAGDTTGEMGLEDEAAPLGAVAAAEAAEPAGWAVAPDPTPAGDLPVEAAVAAAAVPAADVVEEPVAEPPAADAVVPEPRACRCRSGAGAGRCGCHAERAGGVVLRPVGPVRAALLGRQPVDRARRPWRRAVHRPARRLTRPPTGCASRPPDELTGRLGASCAPPPSVTPASSSRPDSVRSCATRGSCPPSSARGSCSPATTNSPTSCSAAIEHPTYLYVSHLHGDHLDERFLADHVSRDTTVLLPGYPTGEQERRMRRPRVRPLHPHGGRRRARSRRPEGRHPRRDLDHRRARRRLGPRGQRR